MSKSIAIKPSKLYGKHGSNKPYNVISDVGTNNNNPFENMYLELNDNPIALSGTDYLQSVQSNVSRVAPKNNPNEYTIGGVLSGAEGIDHFFIKTLSVSIYVLSVKY